MRLAADIEASVRVQSSNQELFEDVATEVEKRTTKTHLKCIKCTVTLIKTRTTKLLETPGEHAQETLEHYLPFFLN